MLTALVHSNFTSSEVDLEAISLPVDEGLPPPAGLCSPGVGGSRERTRRRFSLADMMVKGVSEGATRLGLVGEDVTPLSNVHLQLRGLEPEKVQTERGGVHEVRAARAQLAYDVIEEHKKDFARTATRAVEQRRADGSQQMTGRLARQTSASLGTPPAAQPQQLSPRGQTALACLSNNTVAVASPKPGRRSPQRGPVVPSLSYLPRMLSQTPRTGTPQRFKGMQSRSHPSGTHMV